MSALTVPDAYFNAKEFQSHFETVKSIHDYASNREKKKRVETSQRDIQFFQNGVAKIAESGLKYALKV